VNQDQETLKTKPNPFGRIKPNRGWSRNAGSVKKR